MNATILIPVKELTYAKSRLAKTLNDKQRENLVLSMLYHVLEIVKKFGDQYVFFIVSSDPTVQKVTKMFHAKNIPYKNPGQNRALTFAATQIDQDKPVLTLSADLPLLQPSDIKNLFVLLKDNDIVLAPSKEETGTNAVLMKNPLLIPYQFGRNSLHKFIKSTKKQELRWRVYDSPTIAFDVDTEEDLKKVNFLLSQK